VIIGGLVSSTLLSRLMTPVAYEIIPPQLVGTVGRSVGSEAPVAAETERQPIAI
jgi:hypothetical protein